MPPSKPASQTTGFINFSTTFDKLPGWELESSFPSRLEDFAPHACPRKADKSGFRLFARDIIRFIRPRLPNHVLFLDLRRRRFALSCFSFCDIVSKPSPPRTPTLAVSYFHSGLLPLIGYPLSQTFSWLGLGSQTSRQNIMSLSHQ